jgi:hypothetical protein
VLKTPTGGKKVSFGMNEPFTWNYMPSMHAEISAYLKIKHYKNVAKKLDLFVIRITKGGNLAESRPCFHCMDVLSKSKLNIKNVYYSTSFGTIVCEKFSDMVEKSEHHITTGFIKKHMKPKT